MTLKLTTSLVALSAVLATPVFADVTAADVWTNQQNLFASMGGTLSGDLAADGTVSPELNFILPEAFGSLQIKADAITLSENGDGSVTITYPSPMTVSIAGGIANEGSFAADLIITNNAHTSTATGDAGDITYETTGSGMEIDFADLSVDGADVDNMEITGGMSIDEWTNTSRVTEGDLITVTGQSSVGTSEMDFAFIVDNVTSKTTQTTQPATATINASLPAGGSDVMNLSQALRDGLSFTVESTAEGNTSSSVVTLNGEELNSQETTTGSQTVSLALGENGIVMNVDASEMNMKMFDPNLFPAPLEFAMEAVTAIYDLPLNASEEVQDFRIATSLQGITIGDTIWGLIDPAGQLPRDPAEVSFDITGLGTNGMDLLDFAALAQSFGPPPIQVDEVTIENLKIAAVGAEVSAQGAMTLDWADLQTFAGMPRPEGSVTVNVNGANQLMDTLVNMGLLPAEQLAMPRLMMGMFATPVGDDQLESVIEVNAEGHLLANGQRLQ